MKSSLLVGSLFLFFLLLLIYQWAATADPFKDPRLLYWEFDRPGFSQEIGLGHNSFQLIEQDGVATFAWYYDPSQPPRGQSIDQVEEQGQGQALIFIPVDEEGDWWEYGNFFIGNTPWLNDRLIYARDLGDRQNQRLAALYPHYQAYRWQDGQLLPVPGSLNVE